MVSVDAECARPWEQTASRDAMVRDTYAHNLIKLKRTTCEQRINNIKVRDKYDICSSKYLLYYELFSTLDSESVCLYWNVCTECVLLFLVIGKNIICNISFMYSFAKN